MRLSDYVLMMKEGQIIDQGTSQDLINKKKSYSKDELNISGSMLQIEDGR